MKKKTGEEKKEVKRAKEKSKAHFQLINEIN